MIGLLHSVSVTVPSTFNVSENVDNSAFVESVAIAFSSRFGGATAINGNGYYVSEDGKLIAENVVIVSAYCADMDENTSEFVQTVAENLRRDMGQECVLFTIDGSAFLV